MQIEKSFLEQINKIYGKENAEKIVSAFDFANQKHNGQTRDSGEEYVSHPYAVAKILVKMRADVATVVAGLLHDCLEDTNCTEKEIEEKFGSTVLNICVGLSKVESIKNARLKNAEESENLRKMLLTLGKDARVAFVKLADRLHNMQTLEFKSREKQIKIAQETLDIFTPLAERLGMNKFKHTLEDLCFKYIYPQEFE